MEKTQKILLNINNKYFLKLNKIKRDFIVCSQRFDFSYFKKTMENYRELLKCIIFDITNYFEELKNADFIMFNGSFSRHSNIFGSDLDLNFMYQNCFRDKLLPIELKINYLLSKILNFKGCDRIHSIMVYTPLINNKKTLLINNNLFYEFGNLDYYCRENYEKLLYETCNSSRDYNYLLKYIESFNKSFNEWENNFEMIIDYGKYNDFEKKVKNLKKQKLSSLKKEILIKEINDLLIKIDNYNFFNCESNFYIKDLKKTIKSIPLNLIYQSLSIFTINESDFFKLDELDKILPKELIESIYKYLWILLRVQIVFDAIGYDLSSHSSKEIKIKFLKDVYLKYYNSDIIEQINVSLDILFDKLKLMLQVRKDELNG